MPVLPDKMCIRDRLWIVPVNKMAYFFSKFAVVLVYSICFMLVTATASILTGILSRCV